MLPDDEYDVFVIDARLAGDDAGVTVLDLTVVSGADKGEVVAVRAANLQRDVIDLMGLPGTMRVVGGEPTVEIESE